MSLTALHWAESEYELPFSPSLAQISSSQCQSVCSTPACEIYVCVEYFWHLATCVRSLKVVCMVTPLTSMLFKLKMACDGKFWWRTRIWTWAVYMNAFQHAQLKWDQCPYINMVNRVYEILDTEGNSIIIYLPLCITKLQNSVCFFHGTQKEMHSRMFILLFSIEWKWTGTGTVKLQKDTKNIKCLLKPYDSRLWKKYVF